MTSHLCGDILWICTKSGKMCGLFIAPVANMNGFRVIHKQNPKYAPIVTVLIGKNPGEQRRIPRKEEVQIDSYSKLRG